MPWPSTRSTNAASISEPAEAKCTRRPMPETVGLLLSETCQRCFQSKCRRCDDQAIMIRVMLPHHLRTLAHVGAELELEVKGPVTQRSVLDTLEARYPMLRGTIREHDTQQRRPFLRFFACEEDLSHESPDAPLPDAVVSGAEPFLIIGAIAGG